MQSGRSLEGAWTTQLSGGVPPTETWMNNPQFAIHPTVNGATYHIEVRQHQPVSGKLLRFALWVMKADDQTGRKAEFKGMVDQTTLSASEKRSLEVNLPLRDNGLPYIAFCAPQDAGAEGTFTITVVSVEDTDVRLEALQEEAGPGARPPPASAAAQALTLNRGGAPQPLGAFNQSPGDQPPGPLPGESTSLGSVSPDNQPIIQNLGEGLSKKLQEEAEQKIANALAASQAASDSKFEDTAFPPTDASLGAPASSLGVVSWKRLEPLGPKGRGDGSLFSRAEGVGLQMGSLRNEWLVGSLNVVATNVEVAERIFVDSSHAEHGFYVVRLWLPDDDDWWVDVIDDRLPCDADGKPAFGRGVKPGALWASLVEKAAAKRYGNYTMMATSTEEGDADGQMPGERTLRGLELVTGGKARELHFPSATAAEEELEAPWDELRECLNTNQVVCARCESSDLRAAEATKMGIVTNKTYAVIVAGEMMSAGRLMRMRGFGGDPEWSGKWSDGDKAWTNMLRQQLAYSKDADDGTFWISYADFAKHFSTAFAVRPPDDRWTMFKVKSRWMDQTAGGGPSHISWRENYQWRLEVPREIELTFQLSLPDPLLAPSSVPPMGLVVVRSNPGEDARRRRLRMKGRSEVVFEVEPRLTRRLQVSTRLPATAPGTSYVVVPYLMNPGAESNFTLTILVDDVNDDGVPDIKFEPILPNPPNKEDWFFKRATGTYARAAATPNQKGFGSNAHTSFKLTKAGGGEARVYVCLETIGAKTDMRTVEGLQTSPQFPTIGLVLLPSAGSNVADRLPSNAVEAGPANTDGLWIEATLPANGETHVLVPYLGPGQPSSQLTYAVTIYSEVPLGDSDGLGMLWPSD